MKKTVQVCIALCAILLAFAPIATFAQEWKSDPAHSSVFYTIRHGVTPVLGVFKEFEVNIHFDPAKPLEATIHGTLEANSITMGPDGLTKHLKTADFFDTAVYPQWTFKSTSIVKDPIANADNKFIANGQLTIHGVTKEVAIPFEFLGVKEAHGMTKTGFSSEFTVNRLDYGVGQGDPTKDDGFLGNNVNVTVLLEMDPKK
jgi:polyisoprenoid-binding protein YceI